MNTITTIIPNSSYSTGAVQAVHVSKRGNPRSFCEAVAPLAWAQDVQVRLAVLAVAVLLLLGLG